MKRKAFFINCISLLLTLSIICVVGCVTVFADEPDNQDANNYSAVEKNTPVTSEPEQNQQREENAVHREHVNEYLYGDSDDGESSYEKPEHLDELPEVSAQQVVEATAVPVPTVEVSDASLFSGIVMWLCVALGIAVIVGVLVSKRTRRRGV